MMVQNRIHLTIHSCRGVDTPTLLEALIAINPNTAFYQAEDGSINIASAVGVFIHELSGHLLPEIYNINGNAIERENIIRKELSLPLRKEDLSHVCF